MEIKDEFKASMKDIFRSLPATLFLKDTDGKYVYTTQTCDLVNAGPDGTIIGKRDDEIHYDKALGRRYYEEDMQVLKTGESIHTIDGIDIGNGDVCYIEVLKEAIRNDEGEIIGICGICNDVTELERLRRQYEKLSLHDTLTGAYNRNYTVACDFDDRESLPCSYIFCDCNNLKKTNDSFGHEMGDLYITEAYKLLKQSVMETSVIVRWGGDEFLIITPNCDETAHQQLVDGIKTGQHRLSEIKPDMGLSVGGVLRENPDTPEAVVIKQADQKMYQDKTAGKGEIK